MCECWCENGDMPDFGKRFKAKETWINFSPPKNWLGGIRSPGIREFGV